MRVLRLVYLLMLFVDPQYGQEGFEETSTLQIHLIGEKLFSQRASFEAIGKTCLDVPALFSLLKSLFDVHARASKLLFDFEHFCVSLTKRLIAI
jgi:hypothetical protein